ncbi:MAG: hypothetical protein WC505_02025 [Patescibacteria group bacterium]
MKLTLLLFSILFLFSVPFVSEAQVNADFLGTTFALGTAEIGGEIIRTIQWVLGGIGLLLVLGMLVAAANVIARSYNLRHFAEEHQLPVQAEPAGMAQRRAIKKRLNDYNWMWIAGVCLILFGGVLSIFYLLALPVGLTLIIIGLVHDSKLRRELRAFDAANPNVFAQWNQFRSGIQPVFLPEYEAQLKHRRIWVAIGVGCLVGLFGILMAWAIVIFVPGPVPEVTV